MMSDKEYATPFSLLHSASLLNHRKRIEKFYQAIQTVVTPESYVVDLGTGTGILALLAAKAGAKKVTAIDINRESVEYAKRVAQLNGFGNIIDFQKMHYADFIPEQRADVVICEMLSSMMLIEQQVPACLHAATKILSDKGKLLPQSADVYILPVQHEKMWDRFQLHDLEFVRLPQTIFNIRDEYSELMMQAKLCSFDFTDPHAPISIDEVLDFEVEESGTLHGVIGYFTALLYDDIRLELEDGWKPLFVPFDEPAKVVKGEDVSIRFKFTPGKFDSLELTIE